jgi:hypothetical protein
MKVLQISKTLGADCGISLFAGQLRAHLRRAGIVIETVDGLTAGDCADLILLQHHPELFADAEVVTLSKSTQVPFVIFAHTPIGDALTEHVDAFISLCPGMIGPTSKPSYVFPHPAWVPSQLEDRPSLRREFGLPTNRYIVGTNGFLKFERQFVEIITPLLHQARRNGWFIELITSPWRLHSPGLIAALESLRGVNPGCFRFEHAFLDPQILNRRLQACDLLWCWTAEPSSAYASGVVSDQYASGTRIVAADKQQHQHVVRLPNVVSAPAQFGPFVERLAAEICAASRQRHDPTLVAWDHFVPPLAAFLRKISARPRS